MPSEHHRREIAGFSPEALFVLGVVAQNIGSTLAKSVFTDVRPATVAWIRVTFAAMVLLVLSRRHWSPAARAAWTRRDWLAAAAFGIAIALMNMFFYLGIERIDVGKGVAIEFAGPVAIAASRVRSRRNAAAVLFVLAGVALLSGVELDGNIAGIAFILGASAMWAIYILVGTVVARQQRGVAGLAVGLVAGSIVIAPFGVPASGGVFTSPRLLLICCLVGLLTTVVGYSIDQAVMRFIPPARFALLLGLFPVTGAFIAFVALDERPSAIDLLGIALVIAGVVFQRPDSTARAGEIPAG